MAYDSSAIALTNQNIFTLPLTIFDSLLDAVEHHMVTGVLFISGLHTDASELTISVYLSGYLLNGRSATRYKDSGDTTVSIQLEEFLLPNATNLKIIVQSDNTNDSAGVDISGVVLKPQQSDMRYVSGDADSVTRFKRSVDALETGDIVANAGNTNTIFLTDLTVENANYYGDGDGGMVIAFISGTANQYQTRRIVASVTSTTNTQITLESPLDAVPSGDDAFVVLGRITELS